MTKNKKWEWDSIQINLTDPDKKIITLTSAEVSDFFIASTVILSFLLARSLAC